MLLLNYNSDFLKKDIVGILIMSGPEWYIYEGHRAFPKGISLLKVYEKQATTPRALEIKPHNHISSETI